MDDEVHEAMFRFAYDPENEMYIAKGLVEGKEVMGMGETVKDAIMAALRMLHPELKTMSMPSNLEMDNPFGDIEERLQ